MNGKEVLLIVCKCGSFRIYGTWEWLETGISEFFEKAMAKDVSCIKLIEGTCDFCKEIKVATM